MSLEKSVGGIWNNIKRNAVTYGLTAALSFNLISSAKAQDKNEYVPGKIVYKLNEGEVLGREYGINHRPVFPDRPGLRNIYVVDTNNAEGLVRALEKDPRVKYAERVKVVSAATEPNDPFLSTSGSWGQDYDDLWGLKEVNAIEAREYFPKNIDGTHMPGKSQIVAVIDSGFDIGHVDGAFYVNPINLLTSIDGNNDGDYEDPEDFKDTNVQDLYGHGDHVSNIIGAKANNGEGIIGVASNVQIMPIKIMDHLGRGGDSEILARAITYAADNGTDVINMSLVGEGAAPQHLVDALQYAKSRNVVSVAAAGNNGANVSGYFPANESDLVISVSNFTPDGVRRASSNFGNIDVAAPGTGILSTLSFDADAQIINAIQVGDYAVLTGSSQATPHTAGLIADIKDFYGSLTFDQVRNHIRNTAKDVGEVGVDEDSGYGMIDFKAAMELMPQSLIRPAVVHPWTRGMTHFNDGKLFWADGREGDSNVYMLDLDTGLEVKITENLSNQGWGTLSNNVVVYIDDRNGHFEYYARELGPDGLHDVNNPGLEWRITDVNSYKTQLRFHGDWIAWTDDRNGNWDVFAKNIRTLEEKVITNLPGTQSQPSLYGEWIVFNDRGNMGGNDGDITLHNIVTGETSVIGFGLEPQVFENRVVWEYATLDILRNLNLHDIVTGDNSIITSQGSIPVEFDIHGDNLLIKDDRNNQTGLYIHNLNTKQITKVPTLGVKREFYIGRHFVAFEQFDGEFYNFYTAPVPAALVRKGDSDFNGDHLVDSEDFLTLDSCLSGPNSPPLSANCRIADLNFSGGVDLEDFSEFQRAVGGSK